jgi:CHAD domain-containing protein
MKRGNSKHSSRSLSDHSEAQYIADDEATPEGLAQSLQALVPSRLRPIPSQRVTLLDTFDRRIAAAGSLLAAHGEDRGTRMAWHPANGQDRLDVRLEAPIAFAWDVPSGPLHESIEAIIDIRRLLPHVELEIEGRALDVLDDDRKTVARIRIETGRARVPGRGGSWRQLPKLLTLTALRGYDAAYRKLIPIIESRPFVERSPGGGKGMALQAMVAFPPRNPSLFDVVLAPSVRADAGARQIHRALLDIMIANEPGMRADLDTEFLHDYRVAVRRTRSLLGQIKDVFPADRVAHFRTEFRWLARATGPTRDLDVLLIALRLAPEELEAENIAALRVFLQGRQRRKHGQLVRQLDSDRYRALLAEWRGLLKDGPPVTPELADAARPLVEVSSRRIRRLYRRLVDHASAIHDGTPANHLHQVRIDAKKLRYLIDATRSLHDQRRIDRIIGSLKKVQNVMGNFNDAQVLERHLLECGQAMDRAHGRKSGVLATVARLAKQAHNHDESLRGHISRELARFCKSDIRSDVRRLFGGTDSAEDSP